MAPLETPISRQEILPGTATSMQQGMVSRETVISTLLETTIQMLRLRETIIRM